MIKPIRITPDNSGKHFYLERLKTGISLTGFSCAIDEYTDYLREDALRAQKDHVALTWLLRDQASGDIAAYMSLIADAVKLSVAEKEIHDLDYPFKTIPAMKIGKLAADQVFQERYRGIGTFMIYAASRIAIGCNNDYFACRFLTVDADIEHDAGVLAFYHKNGFIENIELLNPKRKTISMRLDLYA